MGFFEAGQRDWFDLLQSVGIIGSLLLSGASFVLAVITYRRDRKGRQLSHRIAMGETHRELAVFEDSHAGLFGGFAKPMSILSGFRPLRLKPISSRNESCTFPATSRESKRMNWKNPTSWKRTCADSSAGRSRKPFGRKRKPFTMSGSWHSSKSA
jgi:hypothetical protein